MDRSKQRMATIGLILITIMAALQYVFVKNVPESVSSFAFLFITNMIGLLILGAVQIKKVIKISGKTLLHGIILAFELTGFNFFLLIGSRGLDSVIISSVLSLYFIFVTPLLLLLRKKVSFFSGIASIIAVIALLLMFQADTDSLFSSVSVIYLLIADLFFAIYLVTVSIFCTNEDSVQLTFSQMLFAALFAAAGWVNECVFTDAEFMIPTQAGFWVSALFMGIFIRALYGLVQLSCQKYVSAIKTSLIFASEIIITLIMSPFMSRILGVDYTPATFFQIVGAVFFIVATLMVDDTIMSKLGYGTLSETGEVIINGEAGEESKRKKSSVAKKIIAAMLTFSMISLVLSTAICISSINYIRDNSIKSSRELGENASTTSSNAMMNELENKITNQVVDKTLLASQKLKQYSDAVMFACSYAHSLYLAPNAYPDKEVMPPIKENAGKWVMQRTLADNTITYDSVRDQSKLLGNMVDIFTPIVNSTENIATIYMCTRDGLMISFDTHSDDADTVGEVYFEYRNSDWYNNAKNSLGYTFTETYQDSYGRGLTITCVAPFFDENGEFAGCIAIDILMKELNESMVNDGIIIPTEAVLIDDKGNYIAGRDVDPMSDDTGSIFDEDKEETLREAGNEIIEKKNGIVKVGEGDSSKYIAYASVESTNWILCILSPVSEVIKPANTIQESINENTDEVVNLVVQRILTVIQSCLTLSAVIIILVTLFAGKISRKISDPLNELEADVLQISAGNLDRRTNVDTDDEIGSLARSFNHMTDSLQKYIVDLKEVTAKEERIASELSVATNIQASMLPTHFDIFTEEMGLELYATMNPAKEVGGDFYDFFLIDDNHLAMVMADVSGKGVPAALFMVISKTLLKDQAGMSMSPKVVLEKVNDLLNENNSQDMFVTVWMGIMEISTGKIIAANAGHEYPVIKNESGKFELIKDKHGLFLGAMEGSKYKEYELELKKGETLFLYTDGVPEATNKDEKLFGNDRMLEALNCRPFESPKQLLETVKEKVDEFVGDAPQFDDITMMAITRKK